jgi:Ca2+-binding RTX toxin-like protein
MAEGTIRQTDGAFSSAVKFSPDGRVTYLLEGGSVNMFDTASGAFRDSISPGTSFPQAFDVSADGRYLIVASSQIANEQASGNTSSRDVFVYRYDLTTGASTQYRTTVYNGTSTFSDVEVLNNGTVLLSNRTGGPLQVLNLTTAVFTLGDVPISSDASIVSSADGQLQLAGGPSYLAESLALIDAQGRVLASRNTSGQADAGRIFGMAVSATANLALVGTDEGIFLYDTALNLRRDLLPELTKATGVGLITSFAFNKDGSALYAIAPEAQAVFEFSTANWSVVRGFAIGAELLTSGDADTLVLSPDGRYLSVAGATGHVRIDLATDNQIVGTSGADTLLGTDFPDLIFGGLGDDRLESSSSSDTLYGGQGNDTYVVKGPADIIIERPGEGNDTVITSVPYTLPENVETLQLAPGAIATLTSSRSGGTLIGNEFGTLLVGGAGKDTLIGGLGDDILQGGVGDTAVFRDALADATFELVLTGERRGIFYDLFVTSADGRDNVGRIAVATTSDGGLTVESITSTGISTLRFDDANFNTINFVAAQRFLAKALGRTPTTSELTEHARLVGTLAFADVPAAIIGDPTIRAVVSDRITALYLQYGGRLPNAAETTEWLGRFTRGDTYDVIRQVIERDPLGINHRRDLAISALYEEYGGREPTTAELAEWRGRLDRGDTLETVRQVILDDPLGINHSARVITALYEEYGGRPPNTAEIAEWQGRIERGDTFGTVRQVILDDPLGRNHMVATTASHYQEYFGRAPDANELRVWDRLLHGGATYKTMIDALMTDAGSLGRVERLSATVQADTFDLGTSIGHVVIGGFDPAVDHIDLSDTPFANVDALSKATQATAQDVLVIFSDQNTLLLQNIQLSQLNAGVFA